MSGKHPQEPQECSVVEQELQEDAPGLVVFLSLCQFAAAVPGWQAGGDGLPAGQAWKGHSKGTETPCTAKHRGMLEKDKKG